MSTSDPQFLAEITAILDGYDDPAVLIAPDYRIVAANGRYRDAYGGDQPLRQRFCYEASHGNAVPCDQAGESCPLLECEASGQPCRVLHVHHSQRGEEHVDVETRPVRDDTGNIVYFLEVLRHTRSASARPSERGLVGRSPAFNRMLELVERVAASEAPVLLLGESGTGKELVAQAVHMRSPRAQGPFVPVECSGLTESLFESELFGHERGAFTGAHARKHGLVDAARGGTLFLDEIGDVSLGLQVKLLRLLETGAYRRVGGVESHRSDFRLVCATHRDLRRMVEEGRFRQDLYYRISVFPIELPPLRERREDLPLLIESLLRRIGPTRLPRINPAAMELLSRYPFPGNVRELRNILERAVLLCDGDEIRLEHLTSDVKDWSAGPTTALPEVNDAIVPLDELESRYLQRVSAAFAGERCELAEKLGISERTLYRKLRKWSANR